LISLACSLFLSLNEEHRLRVFENRVLKRTYGPKREEVTGGWRRLHNKDLHNLYASPNIRVIISRRLHWMGHVVCMGELRNPHRILAENVNGRDNMEDLHVDGRILLEWIVGKRVEKCELDSSGLG
jgi:hypothetical protein